MDLPQDEGKHKRTASANNRPVTGSFLTQAKGKTKYKILTSIQVHT